MKKRRPTESQAAHAVAAAAQANALRLKAGLALHQQGRLDQAEAIYREILQSQPRHFEALQLLATIAAQRGNSADAVALFDRALAVKPNHVIALNNRGLALRDLKRSVEALASFERVLAINPDYADALNNQGVALRELKRPVDSLRSLDRALALRPDYADAWYNRGLALQDLGRPRDALDSYARALRIKPDHADNHFNEGVCRLLLGEFAPGWRKYEWRWRLTPPIEPPRDLQRPRWTGEESLENRTILLHSEQGLGDTIQFCRYATQVAELGAKVLLEVPPALKTLLQGLPGVAAVLGKWESLPDFDYHCPLMSLPLAFKADLSNITGQSYLQSDARELEAWRSRLGGHDRRRIGLVWSSGTAHENDHIRSIALEQRSIALEQFRTLLDSRADYYCLQNEIRVTDRAVLEETPAIRFFGNELRDFSDTAALVELMDLVITVDTSVAHLAGALGKTVWILLPFSPDWRWLLERSDSPWYRSARLFRQPLMGDWASVLVEVKGLLQ